MIESDCKHKSLFSFKYIEIKTCCPLNAYLLKDRMLMINRHFLNRGIAVKQPLPSFNLARRHSYRSSWHFLWFVSMECLYTVQFQIDEVFEQPLLRLKYGHSGKTFHRSSIFVCYYLINISWTITSDFLVLYFRITVRIKYSMLL